ncbi:MAG: nitroreductase family protein [Eubacteriales bacterium]|nr:nitroreductase family protein [Eubacteriales bacterium]
MTVWESIQARKSIRAYTDEPVGEEALRRILEAGVIAPSAANRQTWRIIAVRDADTRQKMMEACNGQTMVGQAPVVLVVCAGEDRPMPCGQHTAPVDCSIALSFMMLEATELGLGTCWLGAFSQEKVKDVLDIPEDYQVVAVSPLGHPAAQGRPRDRKAFEDIVSYDKF